MKARFHLMTSDPTDGQIKFVKCLSASADVLADPLEKELSFIPVRGMHLTLDEPHLKRYIVWNSHLNLSKAEELLEVELLDPEETSVYPKLRH